MLRRSVEVLGPRPMMPVDMAVRICLASSPPLRSFLGNYDNGFSLPVECSGGTAWLQKEEKKKKKKKSVVFADARGLALAAVHVFDEAEDEALAELQFTLTEIEGATVSGLHHGDSDDAAACRPGLVLVLDFEPPAADYLDLRNRLRAQRVCLETCSVHQRLLSGTVQVQNLCFHKSVSVRITFDSWRSFQDVSCRYLNTAYGGPDIETFAFSVPVPEVLDPSDRVEFCIQYQTQDQTFWDNNQGKNYRLADPNAGQPRSAESPVGLQVHRDNRGEKREQIIECDPFGSPRTSAGIFPEWQSWGRVETSAPYW
ncbi:protein phosphatase 1 regulatory subunit 3C-B-like [Perca flavescens]|uniref:protein phosphatase 1 regulatory subunit 3C-B-like n=1 Tax=Perca flavescens TaxID=8167 RepID=UPI00106E46CE|nr:protein phosphatase 1 regulatory subunit 3C-B-like [Perca flavescens]